MSHQPSTINHQQIRLFGLIGYPLAHSFSKKYFTEKFEAEGWTHCRYELFPLEDLRDLPALLKSNPELEGLNVTIPHKQTVLPFLDEMDEEAAAVGAVNTIKISDGKRKGFNTDVFGFERSLTDWIGTARPAALVLGTGGASKAVVFVLKKLNIPHLTVSRTRHPGGLTYADITGDVLERHPLVINTTPLGMYPAVEGCPPLPYEGFGDCHFAFDLVYHPGQTLFLKKAAAHGAQTRNGLQMLHLQAERAWAIWNETSFAGKLVNW